ncbi:DUF6913 domain-containing protein [Flavobacterium suncheonense]|uniref:Uncharacterized protein n=1 Tax=Flavobacterium suncheonense GH29-5 = DSM 17707 TaxID=1121899 RepID=A0A0A2MR90_9FLAO|nr:hypothetical protein [Flavobacterium suncheonense]KGO90760.1 hypothetical protein Q764_01165 [Flavobacterium suncheonense GH29-5 = DSM 17707]
MFLRFIKDFFIKKTVKKSLLAYSLESTGKKIETVGLLIDETYFSKEKELIEEITANGISAGNIKVLIYKDRIKKKDLFEHPSFSRKDISFTGEFQKEEIKQFTRETFDMLISYYDIEKPQLLIVTLQSKARFKVGFSSTDKRLNNFTITTVAEKHQEFVTELFRYLKILNKI